MIPFQLETFGRLLTTRGPMVARGPAARLRKAAFFALYPQLELANSLLLSLDPLVFDFASVQVEAPVFIMSSPRSGSTVLHRILARDGERFTSFRLWQSLFPSLITQTAVRRVMGLDARLGGGLRRRIDAAQDRVFARADRFHRIRLTEVEEDEVLFAHACASELLANLFPIPEIWREYRSFDALPDARRRALMEFYRRCAQRHLLLEGAGRRLLSKNPPFCHKVGSLHETFPDARFVCLVRNPAEAVCSLLSMLHAFRTSQGLEAVDFAHPARDDEAVNFALDCYRNSLAAFERLPPGSCVVVRYEDLVAAPRATVEHIYETLGLAITDDFRAVLEAEEARARSYESRHTYAPEQFGLTHAEIEEMAGFVYDRYQYPRMG